MPVTVPRDDGAVANGGELLAAEGRMALVIAALERDLQKIRVGGASGSVIDAIQVDHLGRRARLIELATVTIPDPRQIVIRPWDPGSLRAIGTAISQSKIGLTPTIDGGAIRLYVPALTEERRNELAGLVRKRVERAHVELRTVRHEALALVRKRAGGTDMVHRDVEQLGNVSDRFGAEIDRVGRIKEQAILAV
jgi:ribosome recycling factor